MQTIANTNIKAFVASIVDKDYSQANQNLQKLIEDKLKQRINSTITPKNPTKLDK